MGFGPAVSAAGPRGRAGAGGGGEAGDGGVDNARFLLLAFVMVFYMLAGAALFQYLEEDSELRVDRDFKLLYLDFQSKLENGTADMGNVKELLLAYGIATSAGSVDRRRRWDFAGSFHFVGTIVSTIGLSLDDGERAVLRNGGHGRPDPVEIPRSLHLQHVPGKNQIFLRNAFCLGYGSTAPQTTAGKVVVIVYGFLGCSGGILFFNLFLERIITFLAFILRSIHLRKLAKQRALAKEGENGPTDRRDSRASLDEYDEDKSLDNWKPSVYWVMLCLIFASVVVAACASALYSPFEGWTFLESVYFCFVSFATIGFGDYVSTQGERYPHVHWYRFANFIFLVMGCCCIYSLFNVTSIVIKQVLNWMIKKLVFPCTGQAGVTAGRLWRRHSQRLRRRSVRGGRRTSVISSRRRSSVAKPGTLRKQRRPLALGTVRNTVSVCGVDVDNVGATPDGDDSDSVYDSDGERRMSGEMISMKDFLQANKVSLAVMQKQLYETAQMHRWGASAQAPRQTSGGFTPGTVGPLAIVSQKLGDSAT